jgi:hypothetical protein
VASTSLLFTSALAVPIVSRAFLRIGDRGALPSLRAAAEEDDQFGAVKAEIDPIAWAEVDRHFVDAASDALERGGVAERQAPASQRLVTLKMAENASPYLPIEALSPSYSPNQRTSRPLHNRNRYVHTLPPIVFIVF